MGKLTSITLCRLLRKPCGIGARLQMLVFAWLLACLSVSAQKHYMAHVHVGAHGGVSLSNVSFYPHIKEQLLPGMQMGVSFRYVKSNFDYRDPGKVEGFPNENRHTEQMGMEISNRFDYGITAGAGIEFVIARRHSLMLEARYYFGLGNIFPSAKKDYFSASRGTSILVTLGYMFRIK